MSAETLSGIAPSTSIGIESVGPAMSTPSFGGRIDGGFSAINNSLSNINLGGVNNPDLNNSSIIFSLPELKVGSIDTLDKVVPGNLAFTHTEPLWQASEKPITESNSMVSDASTQRANMDTGGVDRMDLNSNIFSQPELRLGSVETFDKVVPGKLAFNYTEILWQSDTKPVTEAKSMIENPHVVFTELAKIDLPTIQTLERTLEQLRSIDVVPTKEPENKISEGAEKILDSYVEGLTGDMPEEIGIKSNTMAILESKQEIWADAEQAAKVKNAWVGIGAPEEEAEELVVAALNEKLQRTNIPENLIKHEANNENLPNIQFEQVDIEPLVQAQAKQKSQVEEDTISEVIKKDMSNPQPKEIFFEEDVNADKARAEIAKKAVEVVSERVSKGENRKINGPEIAEEMPSNPQPNEVRSEIIKESRKTDGSYVEMTKQIAGAGEMETPDAAKQIVVKAIQKNPAVRIVPVKTSRAVTKEDIQKVLQEEVVLFNKT